VLKPITLSQCLLDAFANSAYYPPQDRRQMWAIREGLGRIDPWENKWRAVSARKQHQCERGCSIENGHAYFQQAFGGGWGSELKLCAGCMAMILYYLEVDKLPRRRFTHWDPQAKEPVSSEEG
jgi:hypothetical protein